MQEMEKSGQRIKAKVTKSSKMNGDKLLNSTHRKSSSFSSFNSEPEKNNHTDQQERLMKQRQKQQMLKYYGITQDFFIEDKNQTYSHHICRERMSQFKNISNLQLDPRDERIEIPLNSQYLPIFIKSDYKQQIEPLLDEVRDWLIDVVEIVTSISFNHLKKGHLTEKQVKNYAAKNILLNIKEMLEPLDKVPLAHRFSTLKFINSQLQKIFENVIQKYPQSGSKGASRRIKSKVRKIDNRQSDEYDFLQKNQIKLNFKKSGDYTQQIMKIINRLIAFPSQIFHPNDETQETNFQVFTNIIQYIFQNAGSQQIKITASDVFEIINKKIEPKNNNLLSSTNTMSDLRSAISFSQRMQKRSSFNKDMSARDYLIGQKIPSGTKLFTDEDIQGSNFKINDSSILRILTKWAEQLRNKLQNAEQSLAKRVHKFKTKNGKFANVQLNLREKLYFVAQEQQKNIVNFMNYINKQNIALQTFLSEEVNIGRYSKHDIRAGIYAAKINEIASQYMFKYINKLIHSLLSIPKIAAKDTSNQTQKKLLSSINLLTFKIGDLMRCKYSCSQQQFVKIIEVLQQIDCNNPQILKIVRIKNRLDNKDNDVLINVYFMDKIECEIQLSIKGLHNKAEKDYSNFNHFIYELIRSQLGPISELSNIICQYDPLINNFKKMKQFGPQILSTHWINSKKKQLNHNLVQRLKFKRQMNVGRCMELPFICCKCFHLTIVNNPQFYYRDPNDIKLYCNHCLYINTFDDCCQKGQGHILNYNFNDEKTKSFYKKHMDYWPAQKIIKQIQDEINDQNSQNCKAINIPQQGFYLKKSNKYPKLQLYNSLYDQISNHYILCSINQKGEKKLVAKIPLYLQKRKLLDSLKKGFNNLFLFQFKNTQKKIQNGVLYLICNDQNCCKQEITVGPVIPREQIQRIANIKAIDYQLSNQKSLLNLNMIPNAFQKLEELLTSITDPIRNERTLKGIHQIRAFNCKLSQIKIISKFTNLVDLNVSNNLGIKQLKGIQSCRSLKNLQCKNCSLSDISHIASLQKIESLNFSHNQNLLSIESLEKLIGLLQLNISYTSVNSLSPLSKCLKLQWLDMQGSEKITTLSPLKSTKLSYLNIIGCKRLQIFDLPPETICNLTNIRYCNKNKQHLGLEMVFAAFNDEDPYSQEQLTNSKIDSQKILRINSVLKSKFSDNYSKNLVNAFL